MTVFIASIFLPHTVTFDSGGRTDGAIASEVGENVALPHESTVQPPSLLSSITEALTPTIPRATTELEAVFVPEENPKYTPPRDVVRTSSAHRNILAHRPVPHSPGWGKNRMLNQPKSRARALPSASILQHSIPKSSKRDSIVGSSQESGDNKQTEANRFDQRNYSIEPSIICNGGLVTTINAAVENGLLGEKTWIGTLGMPTNDLDDQIRSDIASRLELDFDSLTVWVDDNDMNGHYEHYCKTVLWPHLHYQIPDHVKSKAYQDHSWSFYVRINQAFADTVVKNWKRGDAVWINDYHLMLVPKMIREQLPDAEIGFFMHTSFPSSEIFKCLPQRTALIEGLLGSNMIGFQVEEYVSHFLQTCSQLLNFEVNKIGTILSDGRFVHVNALAFGIDIDALKMRRRDPEVKQWIRTISEKYNGKRLIIARDKLDTIHGVRQKLLAYERFLQRYPEFRQDVVLIQIATSAQDDPELDRSISIIVQRINTAFSGLAHQPLVFLRQDIEYSQWLALIMVAQCLMIMSMREGMNLTGHEFVYCQDGAMGPAKHGSLILSEFTGAATVLRGDTLLVNPIDFTFCAQTIKQVLDMSAVEKEQRWQKLYSKVTEYSAIQWYQNYTAALNHAYKEHSVRDATSVPRLSIDALKKTYDKASRRLLILDYEGTLVTWESSGKNVSVGPTRACDIIRNLVEDQKNIVYVMSGRGMRELEFVFKTVPGLGLIAENGAFLRAAGSIGWSTCCDLEHVVAWLDGVRPILTYYHERIRGSRIEEFDTSIVLKYDQAEDIGTAVAHCGKCANQISEVCKDQGVHAVPVERGLCVSQIDINKSSACAKIIEMLKIPEQAASSLPEFLLVIGDSRDDEYVFEWAHEMKKAGVKEVITATVGQRNTTALATISQGVIGVLSSLNKLSPA